MQKLKIGDEVMIIAGKDKNKTGKISKLLPKANRVVVEGYNIVKKTMKPTQEIPNGGIASKEASIHKSNVMLVSPKDKKPTRVRFETNKDGKETSEISRIKMICRVLRQLYGPTCAASFSPSNLKTVQYALIDRGLSRQSRRLARRR